MTNILVLDPSRSMSGLLRATALGTGARVSMAESNEEGIARLASGLFDVLIAHLDGPRERVSPLLEFLSGNLPAMPVIAIKYRALRECYRDFPFLMLLERPLRVRRLRSALERAAGELKSKARMSSAYKREEKMDVRIEVRGSAFDCVPLTVSRAGMSVSPRVRATRNGFWNAIGSLEPDATVETRFALPTGAAVTIPARVVFDDTDRVEDDRNTVGLWFDSMNDEHRGLLGVSLFGDVPVETAAA